jgi:hypothetical protein
MSELRSIVQPFIKACRNNALSYMKLVLPYVRQKVAHDNYFRLEQYDLSQAVAHFEVFGSRLPTSPKFVRIFTGFLISYFILNVTSRKNGLFAESNKGLITITIKWRIILHGKYKLNL